MVWFWNNTSVNQQNTIKFTNRPCKHNPLTSEKHQSNSLENALSVHDAEQAKNHEKICKRILAFNKINSKHHRCAICKLLQCLKWPSSWQCFLCVCVGGCVHGSCTLAEIGGQLSDAGALLPGDSVFRPGRKHLYHWASHLAAPKSRYFPSCPRVIWGSLLILLPFHQGWSMTQSGLKLVAILLPL